MRYIKVLLGILFFYVVMLFFVQNQEALAQTMPLKFNLMFLPPLETAPVSFYVLALVCFLLGGLVALLMLVWDRLTISAHLSSSKRRVKSLEKELQKSGDSLQAVKAELESAVARAETAEKSRFVPATQPGGVSFTDDLRQE